MAKIVEYLNPITGAPEQVDQLDHSAQEIDDAVDLAPQLSNPNLLDNWYFGNPVNQRGQTSYTVAGYGIDRWKTTNTVLTSLDNRIKLTSASDYQNFVQIIDNAKRLAGKTVTISFLYKSTVSSSYFRFFINGSWTGYLQFVKSAEWKLAKMTYTFGSDLTSLSAGISLMTNGDIELQAVKLELGTTQTLAHQDADGNWVLNEIPNYGEQLRQCQMYARFGHIRAVFSQITGNARMYVPLSSIQPPMRSAPSVTYTNIRSYTDGTNCTKINQFGSEVDILPGFTISTDVTDNVLQLDYSAISDL